MAKLFYVTSIILMVLSGGCTAFYLVIGMVEGDPYGITTIALLIGGVPFLIFLLIFYAAKSSLRDKARNSEGDRDSK